MVSRRSASEIVSSNDKSLLSALGLRGFVYPRYNTADRLNFALLIQYLFQNKCTAASYLFCLYFILVSYFLLGVISIDFSSHLLGFS